jgi:hypothetical protein
MYIVLTIVSETILDHGNYQRCCTNEYRRITALHIFATPKENRLMTNEENKLYLGLNKYSLVLLNICYSNGYISFYLSH